MRKLFDRIVLTAAGLTLAIAALALVGWTLDVAALKSAHPDWTSMRVVTALTFLACATALLASRDAPATTGHRRAARGLGALVLATGLVSAATYAWPTLIGAPAGWAEEPGLAPFFGGASRTPCGSRWRSSAPWSPSPACSTPRVAAG